MAGKPRQTKIEALLGNETALRTARRSYQPHLCPRLAAGTGSTRPLPGFDLDVIKVAREQLPFVSKNELLEIVPDSQPHPGKIYRREDGGTHSAAAANQGGPMGPPLQPIN